MQPTRAGACAVLFLSVAACGTTVPLTAAGTGSTTGLEQGLVPPGSDGTLTRDPRAPLSSTSTRTLAPTSTRTLEPTGQGPVRGAPSQAGGEGATGPTLSARGVTSSTVTIGAAIPTGTEETGKALGISGAGAVPEEDIWKAVVADVNRSGGVLGRKLVLYNHSIDLASYVANPAQTYAEVCADFRDDHKVFAAMIYVADPSLRSCLARMGTPFILYGSFTMVPAAAYDEFGGNYLYGPSSITQERLVKLFVESLVARSFTSKWDITNGGPGAMPVKLGLIHADTPDQNNLYAAYTRELAKVGLRFSDKVTYTGDASTALASTQNAVLKFRAAGITHVFGASGFFLQYAESQSYRPRYAYLPGLGSIGAANAPPAQLRGAQTVGWAPAQDVDAAQDPGANPGAARCLAVMKAAGFTGGNRTDEKLMYAVCDAVYSFRDAMTAGGRATVSGLRRGYEALGSGFPPALTFRTSLGPRRHYGVSSVRDMAYDSACTCLKYTSRTDRS